MSELNASSSFVGVSHHPVTMEGLVEQAVARAIDRLLRPYLVRLERPDPLVFTVSQAAEVLQLSPDSVTRLVKRGILPRVPHIDGKVLIPRSSVAELVHGADAGDGVEGPSATRLQLRRHAAQASTA